MKKKSKMLSSHPFFCNFRVSQTWLFCLFLFFLVLFLSFKFFFYSQGGVDPSQEVFIHQFPLGRYFCEPLTSLFNKRQRNRDNMTAKRRTKIHFKWWLIRIICPSSGLIIKLLLAGETPNIFLLTGISNRNICFMKKKKSMVVYINIHDDFAFKNLTLNKNI